MLKIKRQTVSLWRLTFATQHCNNKISKYPSFETPLIPSPWPALAARPFWCLQLAHTVLIFPPWRPTHFLGNTKQFWNLNSLKLWTRDPHKHWRACPRRSMPTSRKGTPPPSYCGTPCQVSPKITIRDVCNSYTLSATTQVGRAVPPASETTEH